MAVYLKEFDNHTQYETYINGSGAILPNVSLCTTEGDVHYNPSSPVPPTPRMDIITYTASAKLIQTTSTGNTDYFHVNSFSGASGQLTMVNHSFENGIGIITFNGDITKIGKYAFQSCNGLTSINIPNSITSIQGYAFRYCRVLASINSNINGEFNLPNSITNINSSTFSGCQGLKNIIIPDGVTSISSAAFSGCSNLININIPDSVTSIGNGAFGSCISLTSCTIGSGVTSISEYAFKECSSLTSIVSNATTAPTISNSTFQNVNTSGTLTVPNGSSGYDVWMGTGDYYLGKYGWTKVEQ